MNKSALAIDYIDQVTHHKFHLPVSVFKKPKDNEHFPPIGENINEIDFVKHIMKTRHLLQSDLADIFGGQANVSKFLNGERALSKNQILGLKKRFKISADVFIK